MNIKDTLISAAFELFLKYGIKSVSMDDISKKVGMSKKTIYHFIQNKDELVSDVLDKRLKKDECTVEEILKNSENAIAEMVNVTRHILAFIRGMTPSILHDLKKYHPKAWEIIETRHFLFIENTIYNNLIRGQNEGLYRADFDPTIISKLYVSKSTALTDEDKFPLDQFDRIKLFKEMIMYHLSGIASEEGIKIIQKQQKTFFSL
jgi:AcrR family transcriptional regulator